MQRKTITIHDEIYRELQKIRASFIESDIVPDMSFTTAVNMVLLGGIVATDRFTDDDWGVLSKFLQEQRATLELESFTDRRADGYLENLSRLAPGQ